MVLYFFLNEKFMNNILIVVKIIILIFFEIRLVIGYMVVMVIVSFGMVFFNWFWY